MSKEWPLYTAMLEGSLPSEGPISSNAWTLYSKRCWACLNDCAGAVLQVIWYNSSDAKGPAPSNTWDPPSGAYMFRPNGLFTSTAPVRMQVVEGPIVTEIRQARNLPSQTQQAAIPCSLRVYHVGASVVSPESAQ